MTWSTAASWTSVHFVLLNPHTSPVSLQPVGHTQDLVDGRFLDLSVLLFLSLFLCAS